MPLTRFWIWALVLANTSWGSLRALPIVPGPAFDSVVIAGQTGQRSYLLGRRNLFAASDSLYLHGRLLARDGDYAINTVNGEVYFSVPLEPADTVIALFQALAVVLPDSLVYLPRAAAGTDTGHPAAVILSSRQSPQEDGQPAASIVRFGGSKTFSISAGSGRDLALEQSLNVSANGHLSPGLEISALLSDKNLPLSEAGSTEELSQLDRMYIRASADHWSATLGDFEIAYPAMSLLQVNRQIEGVQADGQLNGADGNGAYSVSKGKAETDRFDGQEGKQGPYKLPVSDGSRDYRVLANSQKVWLDGELLQPGASADYVMDFDRAELTFTPRRPIKRDSRVVVTFQYSSQSFRRSLYFTAAHLPLGGHVDLRAAFLQESDDPDHVTGEALSDSQRAALSRAGNDTSKLWVDGGVPVGGGSGSYVRRDSFYVYAGLGGGDYDVTFTNLGAGQGDYIYDSVLGGFRYAGRGLGDYAARKRLTSPQSFRVANVRSELRWPGGQSFLEGSFSHSDQNTLSSRDDGSDAGQAGAAQFLWKRDSLGWGGFEIKSSFVSLSRTYQNANPQREPDFEGQWGLTGWPGLDPADPASCHTGFDVSSTYKLFSVGSLGAGWGRLGFPGGLWDRKYLLAAALAPGGWPKLGYWYKRYLLGNSWRAHPGAVGRRDLHQARSQWTGGAWGIDAGFTGNQDVLELAAGASSGSRYWETSLGWSRNAGELRLSQSYQRRDDSGKDSLAPSWAGLSYTNALTSTAVLRVSDCLNLSADHTVRQVRARPGALGRDLNSQLAVVHADYARPDDRMRLTFDYSLSNYEASLKQALYVRVPDRTGSYSYDPASGTFYPDTAGNYQRTVADQGATQMANENTAKAFLSYAPQHRLPGARIELLAAAGISAPLPVDARQLLFQRDRLWRPANLRSSLDLTGDLFYTAAQWNGHAHMRWRRESDNQYLGRHAEMRNMERRADFFLPLVPAARLSLFAEYNTTSLGTAEGGLESGSSLIRSGADGGYQLDQNLELAARADAAWERLERAAGNPLARSVRYRQLTAAPYVTRQLGLAGRARGEVGIIYRSADQPATGIPVEYAVTRPLGITSTWSLQYDYRINTFLTSSASYDGRKEPDKQPIHNARFELRAFF